MTPRFVAVIALAAVLSAAAGYYAGNQLAPGTHASLGKNALRLHALTTANKLDAALSTLGSLEQGDLLTARQTLHAEVKSSLVILEHISPDLGLTGQEKQMIEETIAKGSAYAGAHGLR
jgi:hypothetical protein